jgi:predicted  nucleic acid-binding Zn-ribbon protein
MTKTADKKMDATTTVEEKLKALYNLQQIDSQIDKIRTVRGELPLEVQDLEDEIAGLETRFSRIEQELNEMETAITDRKNSMKEAQLTIKKYEEQQGKVRNNREYDSITKEIEFQGLEMQLSEKKIKELKAQIALKSETMATSKDILTERKKDLDVKKQELQEITDETSKEEDDLIKKSSDASSKIEDRLLKAYHRLRKNARNGLAVVAVERDACGGCFNQIPPQRQLDIRMHKKVTVCEHCGRILVDKAINADPKEN